MYTFDKFIAVLKQYGQYSESLAYRLREMQRHPVPGKNELNDLVVQISVGRYAGKQLFAREYADEAEKEQLTAIVNAGEEAVRQIGACGWIFIFPVIIDYIPAGHRFDDLWETASVALHRALITYHHLPSCHLQDYVSVWIEQLVEESFQDNTVFMPSLRQLSEYQPQIEKKLTEQLQRIPSVEEIALTMRYLPTRQKEKIFQARKTHARLTANDENNLRLAMTKVLLVREYKELSEEFTMKLTVTVDGESQSFQNIVRIEQSLMQEVKELYRCGVSRCTDQSDRVASSSPWRCQKCRQEQRSEGCHRWQEVSSIRKQPEQICLWLDDGRKFFIEDDFWSIARQLSSSLDR